MYKALIFDVDGTIARKSTDGSDIDDSTCKAVAQAQQAGFKVACATGREEWLVDPILKKLGLTAPCIVEGGTRIIDSVSQKTLWEKQLNAGAAAKILAVFKQFAKPDRKVGNPHKGSHQELSVTDTLPDGLRIVYLLEIEAQAARQIANEINAQSIAIAHLTPSWFKDGCFDVHVTHPEATKQHALAIWHELEKVTKAETIGMGDSGNDIPLFESAGFKVAVGNSTPDLLELADYVAPDATDHALKHVIDKFLLNQG